MKLWMKFWIRTLFIALLFFAATLFVYLGTDDLIELHNYKFSGSAPTELENELNQLNLRLEKNIADIQVILADETALREIITASVVYEDEEIMTIAMWELNFASRESIIDRDMSLWESHIKIMESWFHNESMNISQFEAYKKIPTVLNKAYEDQAELQSMIKEKEIEIELFNADERMELEENIQKHDLVFEDRAWAMRFESVAVSIAGIIILMILPVFLARLVTKPIDKLKTACETVLKREYVQAVTISTHDEIQGFAKQFNTMLYYFQKKCGSLEKYVKHLEMRGKKRKTNLSADLTQNSNK